MLFSRIVRRVFPAAIRGIVEHPCASSPSPSETLPSSSSSGSDLTASLSHSSDLLAEAMPDSPAPATQQPTQPEGPVRPAPAAVAARARAEALHQQPARVPFFASAAQPEIGAYVADLSPGKLLTRLGDFPQSGRTRRTCTISRNCQSGLRMSRGLSWVRRASFRSDTACELTPASPGTRWLQTWSKELQHGSRLAYFGLTTLLGTPRSFLF